MLSLLTSSFLSTTNNQPSNHTHINTHTHTHNHTLHHHREIFSMTDEMTLLMIIERHEERRRCNNKFNYFNIKKIGDHPHNKISSSCMRRQGMKWHIPFLMVQNVVVRSTYNMPSSYQKPVEGRTERCTRKKKW